MKKIIIIIACLSILIVYTNCKMNKSEEVNSKSDINLYSHNISNDKILGIASKYGFIKESLSFTEKEKYKILYFLDSSHITCCSEVSLHSEFSNLRRIIEKDKIYASEDSIFNVKKQFVTSYKEYFALINSLPYQKSAEIERIGNEALYNKYVDSLSNIPVHIYIGTDGVLTFIPPDLDNGFNTENGKYRGKRLDKMKD